MYYGKGVCTMYRGCILQMQGYLLITS